MSRDPAGAGPQPVPSDPSGLPESVPTEVVELSDGDAFGLRIAPVAKRLGDQTVRMLAYNGSIPGPTLRVPEGSEIVVEIVNDDDMETTVHWHGLRLDYRSDGTHETQDPIPVQEMGLYGNVVNRLTTPANMRWKLVDRATGAENAQIDWRLRVGDRVKIRLVNEMDSDHPMHHPFHVHGAGRFLVLSRDGVAEPNLVWSDTVLVRTGQTVDILLDVTNPGLWMAHCHIAEHHESGMMLTFTVEP